MTPQEIIEMDAAMRERNRKDLIKNHPEVVAEVRKEFAAKIDALEAKNKELAAQVGGDGNAEQAKRIAEFTAQVEQMTKDAADLEAQVAQRDERIKALQGELDALTKQLEQAGKGSADKGKGGKRTRKGK